MQECSPGLCDERVHSDSERGVSAVLFALMITAIVGCTALVIDVGTAFWHQRKLQVATDAGALSGLQTIVKGGNNATATTDAISFTTANDTDAVVDLVEIGKWTTGTFQAGAVPVNAVRVKGSVSVGTYFARIFGFNSLLPKVESIAAYGFSNNAQCLLPFALDDNVLAGKNFGDTIDVGVNSPGNWGKVDLDGNMSCAPCFVDAMTNGLCGKSVSVGDQFTPGTGNGGVSNGFDGRMGVNPIAVLPVVQSFPNGNSSPVTVVGFVTVQILGNLGKGSHWNGKLKFLNDQAGMGLSSTGPSGPASHARALVR